MHSIYAAALPEDQSAAIVMAYIVMVHIVIAYVSYGLYARSSKRGYGYEAGKDGRVMSCLIIIIIIIVIIIIIIIIIIIML